MTSSAVVPRCPRIRRDLLADARAQRRVERGERLVEQHDLGLDRERAGERDALLLAARELVGIASAEAGEPDELEQLADAPARRAARGSPKPTLRLHREVREEAPSWGT